MQNNWPDAEIIEVSSFPGALCLNDDLVITLIVADLRMPDHASSSEGLRSLRRKWPATPIMALSASEEPDDVYVALESGASGYLSKSASLTRLIDVIDIVARGGISVPRDLVGAEGRPAFMKPVPNLTARQLEVLPLVASGYSNKEIARLLGLSPGTVKAHLSSIMRQFNVNNRVRLLLELQDQVGRPGTESSSAPLNTE